MLTKLREKKQLGKKFLKKLKNSDWRLQCKFISTFWGLGGVYSKNLE